jgi:methylmalonyl-CoA mutase cobalamin-binding subunit
MSTILVVANETLAGAKLLEVIRERAGANGDDTRVVICVPRNKPKHGNIIYDDFVFDAAKVRIDLARRFLRDQGVTAVGDIGDPDPYTAAMDAVAEHSPDEIIVSTYPATVSGWLRADLIERVKKVTGKPVQHVEATDRTAASAA